MLIGITGVEVDHHNKEVEDLMRYIRASGNKFKIIYSDTLGVSIEKGKVYVSQSYSRPSGAGMENEVVEVDAVMLRHLGIIRDYEQFAYRLWCIRAFELNGLFVMNPLLSWLTATDKFATLLELAKHGLPIPDTLVTEQMFSAYDAAKSFRSIVVKPLRSAMGFGVFKLDDADAAMHIFSYFTNANKPMYVQRYMEKKNGGDYRLVVVGGQVLGAEFRKGLTWKSNVAQGAIPKLAHADAEMKELAVKATEALKLEYAGIDIAETKSGYVLIEANPTLAWQGFKKATGINPAKYIVSHLIKKVKG